MSEPEEAGLDALEAILVAPPSRLLDALAEGDESEAALRRQDLDALAALALALPPEAPPAALRHRLLAGVAGDETQRVAPLAGAGGSEALGPQSPPAPADPQPPRSGRLDALDPVSPPVPISPAPRAPRPAAPAAPLARPRRASRGAWALAVAATLAALALGGASALLWRELAATREALADSERARAELAAEVAAAEARQEESAEAAADLRALREQLGLVTAPGTEMAALRPPSVRPAAPGARALLWVAEDHQHWYLRADGLRPPGPGRVYRLWFLVGDRPVPAGAFVLHGEEGVLTSPTMPEGTTAAMVTMEAAGATRERPGGPVVLYGKDFVKL